MNSNGATIYYDADCGFCRRALRLVLRIDHGCGRLLVPRSIQLAATAEELTPLSSDEQLASWHLKTADGRLFSGGSAIPELLRLWHWPRLSIAPFENFPNATDAGYRWVAQHRSFLGRLTRWMPDLPQAVREQENPPS